MPCQGRKEEDRKMKQGFDSIMERVKKCAKKTVSVSVAQDSAVLEAVKEAKARGIADAILVGDEEKLYLSGITAGGSQGMLFKFNTFGEEAFLDTLRELAQRW